MSSPVIAHALSAPSRASSLAIALPMPRLPPVTIARLPSSPRSTAWPPVRCDTLPPSRSPTPPVLLSCLEVAMRRFTSHVVVLLAITQIFGAAGPATAAPEGTMTWGVHITLASRWLDPAETEGIITPFMVLYALHDALVKPMPGNINTPSLAESFTASKDGLTYEFVIRKGVKFHDGT